MSHKHYNRRNFLGILGGGCASMGVTTLLNGITNMGLVSAAAAANTNPVSNPPNGYRALVCILLGGGNDSYNMLIPRGQSEYQDYADIRVSMAIRRNQLLPINPSTPDGKSYGLHPDLPYVQQLFEGGDAAFVANVGALVEPTTVIKYRNRLVERPRALFSHSDQVKHWMTSVPQDKGSLGWAGRMADMLYTNNNNQNISMNLSLSGHNLLQQGRRVIPLSLDTSGNGAVLLNGTGNNGFYESLKRQTLDNLLDATYQNLLKQAYSNTVMGAFGSSIELNNAIASGSSFNTPFIRNNRLTRQLNVVAKTIAARDVLKVNYQTFFVSIGGFDTHDGGIASHSARMADLNDAINFFYEALKELGMENSVTTFTISDFARKLVSNGNGTDHAWGGNAMVFGGAVNGGDIYGQYPDLYSGNSQDLGGSQLVPTTSTDEYFAELALWFGASASDLDQILPNIRNFWTPSSTGRPLGFMS